MPRSFVPLRTFQNANGQRWVKVIQDPWQRPEEFPVSEITEKWPWAVCSADSSPGPCTKLCKRGTPPGGQGHGICSFTHPGLRFLPSSCFPGLLFLTLCSVLPVILVASRCPACILLAGPKLPPGCKATGVLSPQLSWGRHVCDLPLRAAPNRPSWCYGPLDTLSSWEKGVKWIAGVFQIGKQVS